MINLASSDAKNTVALAISSGWPTPGCKALKAPIRAFPKSFKLVIGEAIFVAMAPRARPLTQILLLVYMKAVDFVIADAAYLDATYVVPATKAMIEKAKIGRAHV